MQVPDEVRLGIELIGLFGSAGVILLKLGRLGERFDSHARQLETQGRAIDKIEEALAAVAVQKEAIGSLRETVALNTKRTDETFTRIFGLLDRLQERS